MQTFTNICNLKHIQLSLRANLINLQEENINVYQHHGYKIKLKGSDLEKDNISNIFTKNIVHKEISKIDIKICS